MPHYKALWMQNQFVPGMPNRMTVRRDQVVEAEDGFIAVAVIKAAYPDAQDVHVEKLTIPESK